MVWVELSLQLLVHSSQQPSSLFSSYQLTGFPLPLQPVNQPDSLQPSINQPSSAPLHHFFTTPIQPWVAGLPSTCLAAAMAARKKEKLLKLNSEMQNLIADLMEERPEGELSVLEAAIQSCV